MANPKNELNLTPTSPSAQTMCDILRKNPEKQEPMEENKKKFEPLKNYDLSELDFKSLNLTWDTSKVYIISKA